MKNMKLRKYLTTISLLLILPGNVFANWQADGNGIAAIKTDAGYLVVWNQPDIHFTLGLKGKNVHPMRSTGTGSVAFAVDGAVFQVQCVAISQFLKNARKQKLSDQAILLAHQNWELQYLKQSLGAELTVTTLTQPQSYTGDKLLWKFTMPKNKMQQQIYLTMVSGSHVVILNATPEGKTPVPDITFQRLLLDTVSTLKASSRPIDLLELRESIRKNNR
jgi:hypothetical protein